MGGGLRRATALDQPAYIWHTGKMTGQTTVRLSIHTRDALNKLAAERGITADRAIVEAIQAVRDEEWRRRAEREMLEAAKDPLYRAEIAAAIRDLTGDDEG